MSSLKGVLLTSEYEAPGRDSSRDGEMSDAGEILRIETPLYTGPEKILQRTSSKRIKIVVYGGYPDSSLNGGRGQWYSTLRDGRNKGSGEQSRGNKKFFREAVSRINKLGIPFFLAYSNQLYTDEELEDPTNIEPVDILTNNYVKHGVKNGVVVANPDIRSWVEDRSGGLLETACSCTAFFDEKPISDVERLKRYGEAAKQHDWVVLTPQDSVRPEILKSIRPNEQFYAIVNSHCSIDCNSYWHYFHISVENKRVLGNERFSMWYREAQDKAAKYKGCPFDLASADLETNAKMIFNAGIRNFKIGRQDPVQDKKCLDSVVSILESTVHQ